MKAQKKAPLPTFLSYQDPTRVLRLRNLHELKDMKSSSLLHFLIIANQNAGNYNVLSNP